eukprot:TRINITY_DN18369_c0_g1_i5.p1 TRINITY_DN18369_c0_g1~~TRINITY_DN18369_c0_g1_i5.p1  ORF type:complete len:199 (-),score=48.92 TRINITY_DN18369_c0_g1_i5:1570-2079(-)
MGAVFSHDEYYEENTARLLNGDHVAAGAAPPPVDDHALDHSSLIAFLRPQSGPAAARPGMKKIAPNLYLANERTFLNWTNLSLTFGAVGAAAIGVGEKVVGFFIVALGMVICFRALVQFLARLQGLQGQNRQPAIWEDNIGPLVMSGGIVCAAAIVILQAFDQISNRDM